MLEVKRLIQISLLVLVLISSLILGMSMESPRLIAIGVIGAVLGFLVTDLFRLFRIEGFMANVASVIILFLAMKDFFSVDNTGKLVSVANLLVYLQTVLMFQEKTPRLNWQVMVLSLLQVVVGAIFSLNFEAGLLFLLYFVVVGWAMLLQSVYTDAVDIQKRNWGSAKLLRQRFPGFAIADGPDVREQAPIVENDEAGRNKKPLAFFDPGESTDTDDRKRVRPMMGHLLIWIAASSVFTSVLFYLVPRHSKPWYGPSSVKVSSAGISKSVDLDERDIIQQSNQLIFRVRYEDLETNKPVMLEGKLPYFRGLALSNLVIENGKTNWRAPHDRVFRDTYQEIPYFPSRGGRPVKQLITLEETTDPLIYGTMPLYRSPDTPKEIRFCHEVSALTRCRLNETIGMAPYKYNCETVLDSQGSFCKAWPYISNTRSYQEIPMTNDEPQRQWLTQMEPERYQSLSGIAQEHGDEVRAKGGTRLDLIKTLERYFVEPGRFNYSLDYRNVKRDESLDPIEDFVRNHRQGHCEMFASALTLMLRHQDIPSRLVVGFYGVKTSKLSGDYLVRARNAHAWVEAYLRPEDCTPEMFEAGQAGPGGAWLIVDPTPISFEDGPGNLGEEAMDLARSTWDDYVLGVETESKQRNNAMNGPIVRLLSAFDVEKWERKLNSAGRVANKPMTKYLIAGVVTLLMFLMWIRNRILASRSKEKKKRKVSRLRRLFAGAISLIAPGLGQWVMEGSAEQNPTRFYARMTKILGKHDLVRSPSQTHREFASEVSNRYLEHPASGMIQSTVYEVTELFNEVRFGSESIDQELGDQIDLSLSELDTALTQPLANSA